MQGARISTSRGDMGWPSFHIRQDCTSVVSSLGTQLTHIACVIEAFTVECVI